MKHATVSSEQFDFLHGHYLRNSLQSRHMASTIIDDSIGHFKAWSG